MMFINRLFLCIILASHAAAQLRGGRKLSFEPTADAMGVKHVMIGCKDEEDALACKSRIASVIPEDAQPRFRVINYLQLTHSYSCEVKGDTAILHPLSEDVYDDPTRETLHIKDSVEVHRILKSDQSIPYGVEMVKAMDAWDKYNKGENVRVCVMDTGVNRDHPDLESDRLTGYEGADLVQPWYHDMDGHGTHVSGTIAASDNDEGVVGVAPAAEIFTARVFSTNGQFYSSNVITALQACKDAGAKVISMSLGGQYWVSYEMRAYRDLYEKYGIITVAASGNTGGNDLLYPAAYDHVISVGSVNEDEERSGFSTHNYKLNVAAPGSSILSTWENGGYATVSGTSMACPHVSGVVALMLSANPNATPDQIFTSLEASAENPNTSGRDDAMGYGIVNAVAAVEKILEVSNANVNTQVENSNNSNNSNNNNETETESSDCVELVVTLHTDKFGDDIYHWLKEGDKTIFYEKNLDSFETYEETACLNPNVCSEYNIRDIFGDGLTGEGVTIKYNGEVVYQGGDFGQGGVKYFGACTTSPHA